MVIGLQIRKLHRGAESAPPPAVLDSKKPGLFRVKVFAPCLKNEAANQLKTNFIYWKATRVSLDYTHRFAVCAHSERHLPPSQWTMVLQTSENVYHLNL